MGISWAKWSVASKILFPVLGLSLISMAIVSYMALSNIRELGDHAIETSTQLGDSAIEDSTLHLNTLGEQIVQQKALDVAKQVELYLSFNPLMTQAEMRSNQELRDIVVQNVGLTGYTTLINSGSFEIVIHKFEEQEKSLDSLKSTLPSFWQLLETSALEKEISGYYDWKEVDGVIRQKFASITPISYNGQKYTLWATTYIPEFSDPATETSKYISTAIFNSQNYINSKVQAMQDMFIIYFTILLISVVGLALLLSQIITRPIHALQEGAEAIGKGKLDYKIKLNNKDELGNLAASFNKMGEALKNYTEELKNTATENINKEKTIHEQLHLYVQGVSQAQEAERKRIARELHDETAQALVVVARHLDDLSAGNTKRSIQDIREEIRKILEGVRHFSQELRPSVLDHLGLIPAINWLSTDLTNNHGINAETEIKGKQYPLASETELMLFRIIQEALTNIRKHSQATKAFIKVEFNDQSVKVMVQDNGTGFEKPDSVSGLTRSGKLGLTGIQERAQLLGGVMNIISKPGEGTSIIVEIPNKSELIT